MKATLPDTAPQCKRAIQLFTSRLICGKLCLRMWSDIKNVTSYETYRVFLSVI